MTILPKNELDDPKNWAFFERYEAINQYQAETKKWQIAVASLVLGGVLINLGVLSSFEFEFSGVSVGFKMSVIFSLFLLLAGFWLKSKMTERVELAGDYWQNLVEYFSSVDVSGFAEQTAKFKDWRIKKQTDTIQLEAKSNLSIDTLFDTLLLVHVGSFAVPILNLVLASSE